MLPSLGLHLCFLQNMSSGQTFLSKAFFWSSSLCMAHTVGYFDSNIASVIMSGRVHCYICFRTIKFDSSDGLSSKRKYLNLSWFRCFFLPSLSFLCAISDSENQPFLIPLDSEHEVCTSPPHYNHCSRM